MTPREDIYNALLAYLQQANPTATPYRLVSRRLRAWTDVPVASQPALFLTQDYDDALRSAVNIPTAYLLHAQAIIYANQPDENQAPESVLNPLVDAAIAALSPPPQGEAITLGGLVTGVSVAGRVEYSGGILGSQAVAVIPIQVTIAGD